MTATVERDTCAQGYPWTPANTYRYPHPTRRGTMRRQCRRCMADRHRRITSRVDHGLSVQEAILLAPGDVIRAGDGALWRVDRIDMTGEESYELRVLLWLFETSGQQLQATLAALRPDELWPVVTGGAS